jgi:hypothetical protein
VCWTSWSARVPTSPAPQSNVDRHATPSTLETAAQTGDRGIAALIASGLLAIDCALFVLFATTRFAVTSFLLAHVLLCAGAALSALGIAPGSGPGAGRAAWLQLVLWAAFLGPFGGLIGATLLLPRTRVIAIAAMPDEAGSASSRMHALHTAVRDSRVRIAGAHSTRPLLDVIIEGTPVEKLDALSLIGKRFEPSLVPALRRALEDTDASVRVLAATVMAQLNNGYTKRIGMLQEAAQAEAAGRDAWHALAQARLTYAGTGLLEPERAHAEVRQARADLAHAEDGSHAAIGSAA